MLSDGENSSDNDYVRETHATWEKPRHRLAERWGELLDSGTWSDCSFVVGNLGNQKEISCHRLVLGSCSSVFGAMLLGPMAEKNFPVAIPDITPDTFSHLLKFAYTESVVLETTLQAEALLCAADKYMVTDLVQRCIAFLCDLMRPHNVCALFQLAQQRNLPQLTEKCIRMLQECTSEILALPCFVEAPRELVSLLVRQKQLNVSSEQQLVASVMQWALARQQQESLQDQPPSKPALDLAIGSSASASTSTQSLYSCKIGGHVLRKRKHTDISSTASGLPTSCTASDKTKTPSESAEEKLEVINNPTDTNVGLRETLGSMLTDIRFLAPSLDFENFLANYGSVLTEEETQAIQRSLSAFQLAREKVVGPYGPWNIDEFYMYYRYSRYDKKKIPTSAALDYKIFREANPLPGSLYNKCDERKKPKKTFYDNISGKAISFKYGKLKFCNLQSSVNIVANTRLSVCITSNQEIILRGIQVPSQVHDSGLRDGGSNQNVHNPGEPTLTYQESIHMNIHKDTYPSKELEMGDISFDGTVPYNSILDIMFANPITLSAFHENYLNIKFLVSGKYPLPNVQKKSRSSFGRVYVRRHRELGDKTLLQGLIFDKRETEAPCSPPGSDDSDDSDDCDGYSGGIFVDDSICGDNRFDEIFDYDIDVNDYTDS